MTMERLLDVLIAIGFALVGAAFLYAGLVS